MLGRSLWLQDFVEQVGRVQCQSESGLAPQSLLYPKLDLFFRVSCGRWLFCRGIVEQFLVLLLSRDEGLLKQVGIWGDISS